MGKKGKQWQILFSWAPKSLWILTAAMKWLTKVHIVKGMAFPVVLYRGKNWTMKKFEHQRTDAFKLVLEKTLETPLDSKEIKPVNRKVNQPWIVIGRTDAETEDPILWPPDEKSRLIGKKPWCWERLKVKGEGCGRGWDHSIASPTQWTCIWANSRRQWTEQPGMLPSMRLQRVSHDLATKQEQ